MTRSTASRATHHFLVYPKRKANRPVVVAFSRWLKEQLGLEPEAVSPNDA